MSERTMPSALDAERNILGGVLLYREAFSHVSASLEAADFYHPVHAVIYQSMVDLDVASKPIDQITVKEQMCANETFSMLRAIGGIGYFSELTSSVVTVEGISYYARMVKGTAERRRWIEKFHEMAAKGYGSSGNDEYLSECEVALLDLSSRSRVNVGPVPARKAMRNLIEAVDARHEAKSIITGVPSGFTELDVLTAGFQSTDLVIIAGRPSMGKTSLVTNSLLYAAIEKGIPSLLFSAEMSQLATAERIVASDGRIDSTRIRSGRFEQRDWINFTKATARVAMAPLWIDDTSSPSLAYIRSTARRWRSNKAEGGANPLAVVAIDYIQLVQGTHREKGYVREQEIAEISRGLKALAKELRVPVIALSQLNRGIESRADKRPQLSDLRESGAIEQDADVIAFIYRDEVYDKASKDKGIAEIIVGKQRNGPTATVCLAFLSQYTKFGNLAQQQEPPLH